MSLAEIPESANQILVDPYDDNFIEMTSIFATNCVMKSLMELFPRNHDCRNLHLSLQAASMNLQLCQHSENHQGLFQPWLERDSDVLQSLIRLGINMPFTKVFYQEILQSNGLYVLATSLNPSIITKSDQTILDLDVMHIMIILIIAMPILVKDAALGSMDHHVVRFCSILYLIQILGGLQTSDATHPDPEDIVVHKLAKGVSEVIGISDKVKFKAANVRKSMLRFLRCAALFFHYVTDVPLPMLDDDSDCDDKQVYATLSAYLSLPSSLGELIKHKDTFELVNKLLQNDKLSNVKCLEMPPKLRSLMDLPEDYTDLLNKAIGYECPSGSSISGKSKSVAMCLICGDLICYDSYCCKGEIDGKKAGSCTIHARKCGSDLGLFIKLASCQLVILSGFSKGGFFDAPYVDRFGEHDVDLHRGNPLKLDKAHYARLNKMWQQNDLQTFIAKSVSFRNAMDLQWYMI